ncbi:sugar phosphate isomerase/epimerase family protein [Natrialba asiatica]|uniref:AP endonuclease, family 2 superfamily protein n=1 Tax=Natrialba asiatica (strain ATCC 700177 / DSM 12278 / JCM 9576 / FERM P-10747 / NBRC 102637 / 172P1) TaxID=29540 RepID=M0B8S9_NATA1|nr:sugar phosphate isomerase/epimerase [Natrialba asiatica]ELZ06024.1 AP endonuclease, family 2 superfamily protein [Natrialba asiatica DSM 12278]
MVKTAIQLYTLRELDEPLPSMLRRVGETSFDGVEFAGLDETSPETTAAVLEEVGLTAAGAHASIESLESDLDAVVSDYAALGSERLTVPYLDAENFSTADAVRETGIRLETLADRLEQCDFELGYHNHDHEFVTVEGQGRADDGRSAFERLIEDTDESLSIELDVGWAVAAGHDPVVLLEQLEGRVPLVHIKDVADGRPVELGEGEVDLEACVTAARDAGAEWIIYEHDAPADPTASLERGAEVLESLRP